MTQLFILTLAEAARLNDAVTRRFPKRLARAERMRNENDKLRCLGAGALLAFALGIGEEQLEIEPNGKPFAPQLNKQFNLSHSGEYIVLAVSDGAAGVDVQQIGAAREKVTRRCFTEEERRWSEQEDEQFFTVWTLKESVVKAVGKGLRLPLSGFSVLPLLDGQSVAVEGLTLFGQTLKLPGHALAVCSTEPLSKPIEPVFVTAKEIKSAI